MNLKKLAYGSILLFAGALIGVLVRPAVDKFKKEYWLSDYRASNDYKLPRSKVGAVQNFALIDQNGQGHELYRYSEIKAIIVISHSLDCPVLQKYSRKITELKRNFSPIETKMFFLNSNPRDTREEILKEARKFPTNIPVLMDPSQTIAKELGLTRSSEAVLIDPKTWQVVYRGAIDDSMAYGVEKPNALNNYLSDAANELLRNRPISKTESHAIGCAIGFENYTVPIYNRQIVPIIARKCLYCHSEDGQGIRPLFSDYESIKSWAAMIKDTVLTKRMPPWGFDPHYGNYKNDLSLMPEQIRTLISWINSGSPRGPGPDRLTFVKLPKIKVKAAMTFSMEKEAIVPPKGFREYQFFPLAGPMPRDIWIKGVNVVSSNPRTLHHSMMIVASKPLDFYNKNASAFSREDLRETDSDGNIPIWTLRSIYSYEVDNLEFKRFQIWALGLNQPLFWNRFNENLAIFIPKGSYLFLEAHYHGTGREEKERTTVELIEHDGPNKKIPLRANKHSWTDEIKIPPYAESYKINSDPTFFKEPSYLLFSAVHMHMRGKSMKVIAESLDGQKQILFSLPFFSFDTSTAQPAVFEPPVLVKGGTRVYAECEFDNSRSNPYNPDPSKEVLWGQTLDRSEMCLSQSMYYFADEAKNSRGVKDGE